MAQELRRAPRPSHTPTHTLPPPEPTHEWSLREKLALASAVVKSGDQNWGTVSRTIKPFAERPRPPDWFSQKNCAIQYNKLLESLEQPKRKRGDQDTTGQVIVKNLKAQYIAFLETEIEKAGAKYAKKVNKLADLQSGKIPDDTVDRMYKKFLKNQERPVEVFSDDDEYTDVEEEGEPMELDQLPSSSHTAKPPATSVPLPNSATPSDPDDNVIAETGGSKDSGADESSQMKAPESGDPITTMPSSAPVHIANYSAELKNLVQTAITGTESKQRTETPASSPTLSMLLELPPRGPGEPLPGIPSLPASTSPRKISASAPTLPTPVPPPTTEPQMENVKLYPEPSPITVEQKPIILESPTTKTTSTTAESQQQTESPVELSEIKHDVSKAPVPNKEEIPTESTSADCEIIMEIKQDQETVEKVIVKEVVKPHQHSGVTVETPRRITRSLAGGGTSTPILLAAGESSKEKQQQALEEDAPLAQDEAQVPLLVESQKSIRTASTSLSPVKEVKAETLPPGLDIPQKEELPTVSSAAVVEAQQPEDGDTTSAPSPTRVISQRSAAVILEENSDSILESGAEEKEDLANVKDERAKGKTDILEEETSITLVEKEEEKEQVPIELPETKKITPTTPAKLDRKDSTDGTDEEVTETKRVTRRTTSRRTSEDSENVTISPGGSGSGAPTTPSQSGGGSGRKRRHGKMESRVQALCNEANFFFPNPSGTVLGDESGSPSPNLTPTSVSATTPSSANKRLTRSRAKHPTPTSLSEILTAAATNMPTTLPNQSQSASTPKSSSPAPPAMPSSESETSGPIEPNPLSASGNRSLRSRHSAKSSTSSEHQADVQATPTPRASLENPPASEPPKEPPRPTQTDKCGSFKLGTKMKEEFLNIISELEATEESEQFKNGVTGRLASAIKKNVTLDQIRRKVEKNVIKDVDHFSKDVQLLLLNHVMANPQNEDLVVDLTESIWSETERMDKSPTRSEPETSASKSVDADVGGASGSGPGPSSSRSRPSSTSSSSTTMSKAEKETVKSSAPAPAPSTSGRELRKSSAHTAPSEPRSARTSESQASEHSDIGGASPKAGGVPAKKTKRGTTRAATPPTSATPQQPLDEVKALRSRGQSLTLNTGLPTTPVSRRSLNPGPAAASTTKKRR